VGRWILIHEKSAAVEVIKWPEKGRWGFWVRSVRFCVLGVEMEMSYRTVPCVYVSEYGQERDIQLVGVLDCIPTIPLCSFIN